MESEKVLLSRENPRNYSSFPSNNTASSSRAMPNDLAQKPPPPILDRFRARLKQRDDELRVSTDEDVPPPSTEEIVQLYEIVLAELTFNSKPIITDLTIIAGDQREHGEGIAHAICARIVEVPVEQKLPSLYLLDSIVKNIGGEYVSYFSSRLAEVFCEAYRQVHPSMHPAMRHLFGTWSAVFPPTVLHKIEAQLQISPSVSQKPSSVTSLRSSESPRPIHGIHVNPKYLRQLEQQSGAEIDTQHVRGTSSGLKLSGQRQPLGYDEFDPAPTEITSLQVGTQRLNSARNAGRTSLLPGANKLHLSSAAKLARPSEVDEFASDGLSNTAFDHGHGRAFVRDEGRRKLYSDYSPNNGYEHQNPRALIDAYGNDKGKGFPNNKSLQVERLDVNGMSKNASRSWQNTEEEEFDWEDMSPTLTERSRIHDLLPSSAPHLGRVGVKPSLLASGSRSIRSVQNQLSLVDAEDAITSLGSGHGLNQLVGSRYPQDAWNMSHHSSQSSQLHAKGRGRDFQMSVSAGGALALGGEKMAPLIDKLPDADLQLVRPPSLLSRTTTHDSITIAARPTMLPSPAGMWPPGNVHKSQPPPAHLIYPLQKPRSQFDLMNPGNSVMNQGRSKPSYLPEQQFDSFESKEQNLTRLLQLPKQHPALYQQNQLQANSLQAASLPIPPHLLVPRLSHGYSSQGRGPVISMAPSNPISVVQRPLTIQNMPMTSLHLPGGAQPPLPPGPPPASQMIPISQNTGQVLPNQPQSGAFSGLISSLMAQGLISLTNPTPVQDSVGLEFDVDLLKVRHESVLNSLYADLPRQCTTCGLRFKFQEEHSSHMDWHVTRNRMSKNRKQKPSRKWFVSASMWLSSAEALGTDAVPGFLPTETTVEKKDDEELAVPADEEQTVCALCGEPFDDFYSDEMEEWMYKGAVYMNAPSGSTAGMDRSQLGPIVHAKCRPESSVVPSEDFAHDEGENTEDGSQRKRMRS
ncbi:hypothetical protein SLEP1_g26763 [Rubroshorea leprosula]|uniref:CID domain-containing protein n=1 Tax=Rubroshorea leprosula TaxID=152421 RepID=A0AAV5JN66_9ROSI|nr:hypothetical protein SLEP1_g26763 [Rubroshorea leprosula]